MGRWQLLSAQKANANTKSQCFNCWTVNTELPWCEWNPSPHLCNISVLQRSYPGEDRITGQHCSPCMGTVLSSSSAAPHCQDGAKLGVQLRQVLHKHSWNKTALGVQFFSHYTLRNTGFKYIHWAQQIFQFRPRLSWHESWFFSYMILILLSHFLLWKEKVLF